MPNKSNNFKELHSLRQYAVEADQRNKFIDSVLSSMQDQKKDRDPDQINGLRVYLKATHAGRATSHYHLYMPKKVKDGVKSWLSPYNKPVLAHHEDHEDAIGRVVEAKYIETPPALMPAPLYNAVMSLQKQDNENMMPIFKKIMPYITRRGDGMGYTRLGINVVDEDAIAKIIDGRYLTVSIGYDSPAVRCSVCGNNWRVGDYCDHRPGKVYDGVLMLLVFDLMQNDEISFVNRPADDLAQVEDFKKIMIPAAFGDSADRGWDYKEIEPDLSLIDSTNVDMFSFDNKRDTFVPQFDIYDNKDNNNGENMKLKTLKTSDDLYAKLSEHLDTSARMAQEDFAKLEDKDFVGKRFLPAHDLAHIEASKKLLAEVDDCGEKTTLLKALDERAAALSTDSAEGTENSTETASTEGTSETTETADNKDANVQELALALSADEKTQLINSLIDSLENKTQVIEALAEEMLDDLKGQLEVLDNEKRVATDKATAMSALVDSLTVEVKDNIVGQILSFQKDENPELTKDELASKLKTQSLQELRASRDNLSLLFGDKTFVPEAVQNPTEQFTDETNGKSESEVTPETIQGMKDEAERTYRKMLKTDQKMADAYRKRAMKNIAEKEKQLQSADTK